MSENAPKKTTAADWVNRIIILIIAVFALIAGLPMVFSGAASILFALTEPALPGLTEIFAFIIGVGLTAFAGMIAWKMFFGASGKKAG